MVYTPKLLPSTSGLNFTGNFIGIAINEAQGPHDFNMKKHQIFTWGLRENTFTRASYRLSIRFYLQNIQFKGDVYEVEMNAELYSEED